MTDLEWTPEERLKLIQRIALEIIDDLNNNKSNGRRVFDKAERINLVSSMSPEFLNDNLKEILEGQV